MNEGTQEYTWWLKIIMNKANNVYYFGDFESYKKAERFKKIYINNLDEKKAKKVNIQIELNKHEKINTSWRRDKGTENLIIIKNNPNKNTSLTKLLKLSTLI